MNFCKRLATKVVLDVIKGGENKNVVTSPLSLHVVLNMLAAGSRGRTLEQLQGALDSKSIDELNLISSQMMALAVPDKKGKGKGGPLLSIVNGIWVDHRFPLKASFVEIAKKFYKADATTVDFFNKPAQVVDEVNNWVENGTKGLIKDMLSPKLVPSDTIAILANALYFKGAWKIAFDKSWTRDKEFYLLNGETVKVPFMTNNVEGHFYGSFDGYQLLKLPYRCGDHKDKKKFSMYVFLPNERTGLQNLLQKFNSELLLLHQQCDGLHRRVKLSNMWLPKFKFSYQFEPSDTMKELGITLPFKYPGELTEMVDCIQSELVYVSTIIQKSFIEVNEEGTEAAAVTCALIGDGCPRYYKPPPAPSFVADHPFVFMIKEEVSGMVFFTGAVLNPLSS